MLENREIIGNEDLKISMRAHKEKPCVLPKIFIFKVEIGNNNN